MGEVMFVVVRMTRLGDGRWRAEGRAYEDVYLGDVVLASSDEPGHPDAVVTVVRIRTYGEDVPELNRMTTGELTVDTETATSLEEVTRLSRR